MTEDTRERVLFMCVHNSCRSQMAQGFLNAMASASFEAYSAGSEPTSVNPLAIRVMSEVGIDISGHSSKHVGEFADRRFDYAITVCADEGAGCPVFVGRAAHRLHWEFEDPAAATGTEAEILETFRRVRDEIRSRIESFIADTG